MAEIKEKAREKKKASVNVVNTVGTAPPAAPAAPAVVAAAPAAGVNSVQVVPQPAYTFNPERFSETPRWWWGRNRLLEIVYNDTNLDSETLTGGWDGAG